jgi:hypothetical protein
MHGPPTSLPHGGWEIDQAERERDGPEQCERHHSQRPRETTERLV